MVDTPVTLQLADPIGFLVELTGTCPNQCRHCGTQSIGDPGLLSYGEWVSILEPLRSTAKRIAVSGGEPTLHPNFAEIMAYLDGFGTVLSLFTNGLWPSPRATLDILKRCRLNTVLITLLGHTAELHDWHTRNGGSFKRTVATLQNCAQEGLPVLVNTVLTTKNIHHIEEIVAFAKGSGAEYTVFDRLLPIGIEGERLCPEPSQIHQVALRLLRGELPDARFSLDCTPPCCIGELAGTCLAGHCSLSIGPSGDVRPCARTRIVLGNALKSSFKTIWESPVLARWLKTLPAPCWRCGLLGKCLGGCKAACEYYDGKDPVLEAFSPWPSEKTLDIGESICEADTIIASFEIIPQPFGAALVLGKHVVPVSQEGAEVSEFLLGRPTVAQVQDRFGEPGIELVGELYSRSYIDLIPPLDHTCAQ